MSRLLAPALLAAAMLAHMDRSPVVFHSGDEIDRNRREPVAPAQPASPQPYRPSRRRYERDRAPRTDADAVAKARAEAKRERRRAKAARLHGGSLHA